MRLWILGLALLAVGPSWAGDVTVKDGVTIAVDGATFRLDGIDAPEADQFCLNEKGAVSRCGIEARDRLKTLLAGRAVHCEDKGQILCTRSDASVSAGSTATQRH